MAINSIVIFSINVFYDVLEKPLKVYVFGQIQQFKDIKESTMVREKNWLYSGDYKYITES